jgi:hypothetical protein
MAGRNFEENTGGSQRDLRYPLPPHGSAQNPKPAGSFAGAKNVRPSSDPYLDPIQPYDGFTLGGVPFYESDTERLVEGIVNLALEEGGHNPVAATQAIGRRNNEMVGRSALLLAFAAMIVGSVVGVEASTSILTQFWDHAALALIGGIASVATVRLIATWRHNLPPPEILGRREHVFFMARLYVARALVYNVTELVLRVSFGLIVAILVAKWLGNL